MNHNFFKKIVLNTSDIAKIISEIKIIITHVLIPSGSSKNQLNQKIQQEHMARWPPRAGITTSPLREVTIGRH